LADPIFASLLCKTSVVPKTHRCFGKTFQPSECLRDKLRFSVDSEDGNGAALWHAENTAEGR
jgi:hypothetical protein